MKEQIKKFRTICFSIILSTFMFNFMGISQAASAATVSLAAPVALKTVAYSYNSIYISWKTVAGASGYTVYRAASSNGTYKPITTTMAETYKDTGLTTGKTYYYKIRAYIISGKTKKYGKYSQQVSVKPSLSAPASVKASQSSNGVNVSWSGVSGATGYMIYRATSSKGSYSLLATTASKSYVDAKLKTGTSYYYKVRAYVTVGKSKVYSDYSTVVYEANGEVKAAGITLSKSTDTLTLGETDTLVAIITSADEAGQSVIWKSSNTAVVTIDSKGTLTTVSKGEAIITAATADGTLTATCEITVTDANSGIIKGIDVSKWQGTINWASVKSAGIKFAMMRSSFGSSDVDPMFSANYAGAKANGIAVGAYHYSYATTVAKATTEVNFFIKQLQGKQFEYPVCVDIEDSSMASLSKDTLTDIVLVYLNKLSEAGYYPMIYANKSWFTSRLDDLELEGYDRWLAQWASSMTYAGSVGIWQYSDNGSVSGISGAVDMDTSYVDYANKIKKLHLNGF